MNGVPQPNPAPYDRHFSLGFCSGMWFGCSSPVSSKTLAFDLPAVDAAGIVRAQLVYDVRQSGHASLIVNGVVVGPIPDGTTVPEKQAAPFTHWAERSVDVSPSLLHAGTNTVTLQFSGDVAFDRLRFDLAY